MEVEQLLYLPHEIVVVILSRLPVKSLLQFKSVCKRWYSLISDPQFVKMHLNQVSRQRERIMLSSNPYQVVNPVYFIDCELFYGYHILERIDFPSVDPGRIGDVYGSCNGLVLIVYNDSKLFLWNPSMRECREVPYPHWTKPECRTRLYGLGYDSATDDYKLALLIFDKEFRLSFVIFVYSLKANGWNKKIEICKYEPGHILTSAEAAVVNGALHWVMIDNGERSSSCRCKVVYFDLADEKLKDMPLPPSITRGRFVLCLGVLGSCLCILGLDRTSVDRVAHVWVMKEYGVGESWTNVINFKYYEPSPCVAPFCFTKDGDIVVEIEGENKLLMVNCERKTWRWIPIHTWHAMAFRHAESLVSVYGSYGSLKRFVKRKR